MFIFGHLGVGNKIASPWSKTLPKFPLFLGMLLPDIIDKILYYGLQFLNENYGTPMGLITSTRTVGHTGLFLVFILLLALPFREDSRRSRWFAALGLGIATHLVLDCLLDRVMGNQPSSALIALTWPFMNNSFYVHGFKNFGEHLAHLANAPVLISELIGLSFLGWDYWKKANRAEMSKVLFSRQWRRLKRRRLERD